MQHPRSRPWLCQNLPLHPCNCVPMRRCHKISRHGAWCFCVQFYEMVRGSIRRPRLGYSAPTGSEIPERMTVPPVVHAVGGMQTPGEIMSTMTEHILYKKNCMHSSLHPTPHRWGGGRYTRGYRGGGRSRICFTVATAARTCKIPTREYHNTRAIWKNGKSIQGIWWRATHAPATLRAHNLLRISRSTHL